jgi:SAM-dependent methyltransferase
MIKKIHDIKPHDLHVTAQFGPRAAAYVASAVHAFGEDLTQIAALAEAHKPQRALDLGCGGGHVSFHIAPHAGEVTAFDLSADMLGAVRAEARKRRFDNIVTRRGSVEAIDSGDGSFDFVASRYSAHHWHNVEAGLREARRVLAPGGVAIFADVIAPEAPLLDTHLQAMELLRDPSHVRDYRPSEWIVLSKAAGFAPGTPTLRRVRMDFPVWIARMATPEVNVRAIRALQASMPRDAADHFELEADGSFTIDALTIEAAAS